MEAILSKPYLKPGGFSEPVVAMKKFFNSTQSKSSSQNHNSSTVRSKSSLLTKQLEKCCNNFSFDHLNPKGEKKTSISKRTSNKTTIKDCEDDNFEECMVYAIKPEYSKKILMHTANPNFVLYPKDFCTERNEKPKRLYGNLSVDNRHKKVQSSSKIVTGTKLMEVDQIINESQHYKENIGLKATIKRLRKDLEGEKERNIVLENEIKALKTGLQNERTKYQRELLKFSEKIKNFKNIQTLYVGEKQNSERIEKDLNQKDSVLQEYQKKFDEILGCLMSHNKIFPIHEQDGTILIDTTEKANAIFDSFKNLFNSILQILRPISIRHSLTKDLQSIQMLKIHEKPIAIKEIAKRIQKINTLKEPKRTLCERINPKLEFALPKGDKKRIINEFEKLDSKLECVNQKIDNEIRRQSNSLEKAKSTIMLNNYNSFSCVSDQLVRKEAEEEESERVEINNTFQIENIDYEQFKSNLDKEMEEVQPKQQSSNINFEQISEIKEDKENIENLQLDKERSFKDPSPSKSLLSELENLDENKEKLEKNIQENRVKMEDSIENKENAMVLMKFAGNNKLENSEKKVLQERKTNVSNENRSTPKKQEMFAFVKFDYSPKKENDLKLQKGDRIQILKKTQNGWWIGMHKNKIGFFPFNYVEIQ